MSMAGGSTNIESRLNRQGWIVLSVKDSGIGMAPGDIERALQPFSQLETNIIHEQEGVGLGDPSPADWRPCTMANYTWRVSVAPVPWRTSCYPQAPSWTRVMARAPRNSQ
jgi:hypothetical protein